MALTTTQKTEAYQFFIVAFGAATGVEYMNQLNDAYNAGMTTKQIVNVYTTKPQTYIGTWLKSKLKASYKANGANNTLAPAVSITINQILGKGRLNNFCAPKNTPSNNTAPAISKLPNHTLDILFMTPACVCAP